MAKKTQDELEKPAKVYQVDAVEKKVDDAIDLIKQVIDQTKGVATHADLATQKKDIIEYVDDEVRKVHLEYGPTKKGAWWLAGLVITALVGQIIFQIYRG